MTNQNDTLALSRVSNAMRDKVTSYAAFKKANERLNKAIEEAKQAGVAKHKIEYAMAKATIGNDRVQAAFDIYASDMEEAKRQLSEQSIH